MNWHETWISQGMTTRRGFTLIEVLLAMAIVSFVLFGTAELLVRAQQLSREADARIGMTDLLVATLEGLKSRSFDGPDLDAGDVRASLEPAGQKTVILERRIEAVSADLKRIELVLYAEDARQRGLRAVLYVSRFLGF
jgi:prepilin-type N-terminal cleavage/methylation domain-containing protein